MKRIKNLVPTIAGKDTAPANAATTKPELGPLLAVLFMLIDEQKSIVVHLTSSKHNEGTTTVARELAAAAAQSPWCKVALISVQSSPTMGQDPNDPILPSLVEPFEAAGNVHLHRTTLNGTQVAMATLTGAPHSVPRMDTVRRLYAWLRSEFTLIIIDAPPVLESRNAVALAAAADSTILVVEAERTRLSEMQQSRDTLEHLGATVVGVALNKRQHHVPDFISKRL